MRSIVIIGGGVIGLATAYRCALRGAKVTLLEKGTLGCGSTLASLGAARRVLKIDPVRATVPGGIES